MYAPINIPIDQPEAAESRGCFQDWKAVGVSDDLCVIVVLNGRGQQVRPTGKVDDSRSGCA